MNKKRILQLSLLVAAAAFIVIGVFRDEISPLFVKAINICLECIGLG